MRNEEECVCIACLFRCTIFIDVRIIKEMPASVASGTSCLYIYIYIYICTKTHISPSSALNLVPVGRARFFYQFFLLLGMLESPLVLFVFTLILLTFN